MEICHKLGCDCDEIQKALTLGTKRIYSPMYTKGGMGDGGNCHPRDNIALSWLAQKIDLSYDLFESMIITREAQTEWLANMMINLNMPMYILGSAYKKNINLSVGSPAILLYNILKEKGFNVIMYDPYIDDEKPRMDKGVYLIGVNHDIFVDYIFPVDSVVLDPWGYLPKQENINIIHIGR